jgi:hypothetical protein
LTPVPERVGPATPELCSLLRQEAGEPLAGTATQADLWVALEHPGPYPRRAVPDALTPPLAAWVAAAGSTVRVQLIRRPTGRGTREEPASPAPRTVFVARSSGAAPWLARGTVTDLDQVAEWPVDELRSGNLPAGLTQCANDLILVCTNGRRDACCAKYGRAAADALRNHGAHDVWETTHLGGHRFAPAVLQLPSGYQYGGGAATTLTTDACRGRSGLSPDAQVAELAVLTELGASRPVPLDVDETDGQGALVVTGTEGRRWQVSIELEDAGTSRPESCGKPALPLRVRRAVAVTPLTGDDGVGDTRTPERT